MSTSRRSTSPRCTATTRSPCSTSSTSWSSSRRWPRRQRATRTSASRCRRPCSRPPDTSVEDYVAAEQGFERIRDAYAQVFTEFDAVLLPVLPIPAHEHDATEFVIDGQTVDATHIQTFTVQFNITGMPALSMRFGTSSDGLPIGVQIAGPWHAESTVFAVASLLESISPVRDQHPEI
ncbi:amidase family protein [Microbacterium sp. M1A1_1b]